MDELAAILLQFSDSQLDASVKPKIRAWSNPPLAIEILQVLDACAQGALASGWCMRAMDAMLRIAIEREGTTFEAIVARAEWRKEP